MSKQALTVALVQHHCQDDYASNMAASIDGICQAAARGAQLVLLQELHSSRYFCQIEDTALFTRAEPVPGPTTTELARIARREGIVIVASVFEQRTKGIYHNTAVILERDGHIGGSYRKMHIPDDPGYYEKYYFTPGEAGFRPVQTSIGRLGVLICWDQWFPEAARIQALAGAQILLYPSAIGWHPNDDNGERQRQLEAWITIQRGHAIANCLPLLSCNRVGFEAATSGAGIEFWGSSFICGPQGERLAQASANQPQVLVAELDLSRSEYLRNEWPFLRDRRIDAYQELMQRCIERQSR